MTGLTALGYLKSRNDIACRLIDRHGKDCRIKAASRRRVKRGGHPQGQPRRWVIGRADLLEFEACKPNAAILVGNDPAGFGPKLIIRRGDHHQIEGAGSRFNGIQQGDTDIAVGERAGVLLPRFGDIAGRGLPRGAVDDRLRGQRLGEEQKKKRQEFGHQRPFRK